MTDLVEKRVSITRETLLILHSLVVDKILDSKGQFRTVPVYIRSSNMTSPSTREVERLMREWMAWISGTGLEYEPVTRAAIAHHGFEAVHPYADGNGRVGRLLLNLMLMQEGYPPALLLHNWRVRYIHALNTANAGNCTPLINIIGHAVEAGLDLYLEGCAVTPEYQVLAELAGTCGYRLEYLSWLARQGRIDAMKRGGRWYSMRSAIEQYKAEAEQGKLQRGRPSLPPSET
ncbi:MAG: Fic family protein [Ktedonobacteraceae bacterium]